MSELSKVLFPNKSTGDTFTAAEVNELKNRLNAAIDAVNLLNSLGLPSTSPVPSTISIPSDRVSRIQLSDSMYAKALAGANATYNACNLTFSDGSKGISPGLGNPYYATREWMRDSTMGRMGFLDYFQAAGIESSLNRFLSGRNKNVIPDRIRTDGGVEPVPFPNIGRSPLDNGFFFIETVYLLYKKTGSATYYKDNKEAIDAIYSDNPFKNECCYIPDQNVGEYAFTQGFGFNDSIFLSGYLFYAICLQYRALRRLAELNKAIGNTLDAGLYVETSVRVKSFVNNPSNDIYDTSKSLFRSATIKGNNVHDIWSNGLAVETGLANDSNAIAISQKLNSTLNEWSFKGGVRHIATSDEDRPGVSCWSHFVTTAGVITTDPNQSGSQAYYNEYQNGGYWYTPIREVSTTLALTNQENAKKLIYDAITYANTSVFDNCETFTKTNVIRCYKYVASAGGILSALTGGGSDPVIVPVTSTEIIAPIDFEESDVNDNGYLAQRTGTWLPITNNSDLSANNGIYTMTDGVITINFKTINTSKVDLIAPTNLDGGVAQVQIDGGTWNDINMNTQHMPSHVVYTSPLLTVGNHTLIFKKKSGNVVYFDKTSIYNSTSSSAPVVVGANSQVINYSFNEPTGNYVDSISNISLSRVGVTKQYNDLGNSAAMFSSNSAQYLTVTSNTGLFDMVKSTGFSLRCRMKIIQNGQSQVLFAKGSPGKESYKFYFDNSDNKIKFQYTTDGVQENAYADALSTDNISNGTWFNFGFAWNGTSPAILINGAVVNYNQFDGSIYTNSSTPFIIGSDLTTLGAYTWNGGISDLRIYNYALGVSGFQ